MCSLDSYCIMRRFNGYLDGVHEGEVCGWVIDQQDPDTPAVVTILVNGAPFTRVLACQHRADVGTAYQTSGLHGFKALLPDATPGKTIHLSAICDGGQPVGDGAKTIRLDVMPKRRLQGPCVLFMHIQKTAGTAFRDAILGNYATAQTALIYPNPPGIARKKFRLMPEEQRRDLRFAIGHFKFGIHEELGQPYEYVTILRDPVQRVISNYRHLCRNGSTSATLESLLESGAAMELDNLMTRFFCGQEGIYPAGSVDQDWYERALANARQFRFIGNQARPDAAWTELCRLYGWSSGTLHKVNAAAGPQPKVSARTQDMIASYNRYDLLLYRELTDV